MSSPILYYIVLYCIISYYIILRLYYIILYQDYYTHSGHTLVCASRCTPMNVLETAPVPVCGHRADHAAQNIVSFLFFFPSILVFRVVLVRSHLDGRYRVLVDPGMGLGRSALSWPEKGVHLSVLVVVADLLPIIAFVFIVGAVAVAVVAVVVIGLVCTRIRTG